MRMVDLVLLEMAATTVVVQLDTVEVTVRQVITIVLLGTDSKSLSLSYPQCFISS